MKRMLLIAVAVGSLMGLPSRAADDFERHVKHLAAGMPERDVKVSLEALRSAGMAACPILLAHLSDMSPAEPRYFQREVGEIAADGTMRLHAPTIGEACFDILQDQIEGNWPKGFRDYYVLTLSNAKEWLEAHAKLTLPQLKQASLTESLHHAEADLAKDPANQFLNSTVEFLRKEIKEAK